MILFDNISKIYQVGDETIYALNHANINIADGEFVSIVGPSGSGKSTLMNIIGCLDVADRGRYYLDGAAIESYSEEQLTKIRNHKIGFIFQNFNLIGKMNAYENVELPLIYQRLPKNVRKEKVLKALGKVGLLERMKHKPTELSGGQQQRVAIARAIATEPALFLADEPTGNLDSHTGEEIMTLFHELHQQGTTIVLITHDEGIAKQTPRSIRILDGQVQEVSA